jgi:lipoprotein-releasing system ATP-binding protein
MSEPAVLLEARNLGRKFMKPELVEAIKGVNFSLFEGELVAMAGPSGSGKSTLLALLGGLMTPTSGTVSLRGRDLSGIPDRERTRRRNLEVGFVFQFHHLLPELTVTENVMLPALIASREGWSTDGIGAIRDRALAMITSVGLASRARHFPTQISGGEAQRVAIARALMNRPAIILADEPTGNLDRVTASGIMDLFEELNRTTRQTFLVATHNPELVDRASRALHLVAGEMNK